jgi:hypothetical protein
MICLVVFVIRVTVSHRDNEAIHLYHEALSGRTPRIAI